MQTRTADILEAAVREYIHSGEPVSSGLLYDRYDFGIKPAMIRLELNDLAEHGYLAQPHHAAGRVPRDKAFEFYVARVLENLDRGTAASTRTADRTFSEYAPLHAWSPLASYLSRKLDALSVFHDSVSDTFYKEGLERLVSHLEWATGGELAEVIRDVEALDDRLADFEGDEAAEGMQLPVEVFIGRRSPLTKSDQLATFFAQYPQGNGTLTVLAIGPKRMDYQKGAQLFRSLYEVLNEA